MKRLIVISRLMRRWHKQIGIFTALFFAFLAGTGLLLNHGDLFTLAKTEVKAPWLMQWYGLKTKVPDAGFRSNDTLSAFSDKAWVIGGKVVAAGRGDPIGIVLLGSNYWVATPDVMSIYQRDGQLVDRMDMSTLPALPIRRVGIRLDKAVIDTAHGTFESSDGLSWTAIHANVTIAWSHAEPLGQADKTSLAAAFAPALTAQRIVSDLHSGHIWGRYGILINDAIAVALMLMAFSGMWVHFRNNALRHGHPEHLSNAPRHGEPLHRAPHGAKQRVLPSQH